VKDPSLIVSGEHTGMLEDESQRAQFMTLKEHPVKAGRVVHYLHECQMPEMFKEKSLNQVAKWASVVFPSVFGLEIIGIDVIKNLLVKSEVYK
jgi:hypothetical protein